MHLRWLLGNEIDVEDWRVGSKNINVTKGQGLCTVRGARRVRKLLALKHLGVDGWEIEKTRG